MSEDVNGFLSLRIDGFLDLVHRNSAMRFDEGKDRLALLFSLSFWSLAFSFEHRLCFCAGVFRGCLSAL